MECLTILVVLGSLSNELLFGHLTYNCAVGWPISMGGDRPVFFRVT